MVFHPSEGANGALRGHLARGNPQWRDISPDVEALALFDGPDSYITPALVRDQAADGQGRADLELHHGPGPRHARRSTTRPSGCWPTCGRWSTGRRRARPEPWSVDDPPEGYIETQARAIVGLEMAITQHRRQAQAQPEPHRGRLPGRHRRPVAGFPARAGRGRRDAQGVTEVLMPSGVRSTGAVSGAGAGGSTSQLRATPRCARCPVRSGRTSGGMPR